MKKISSFLVLMLALTMTSKAQLKYEGTVESRYKTMQLEDGSFKYVKYNKSEKKVYIYNIDNTIWKSIHLTLPKFHLLDEIKHISINTFNKDQKVELVYSCVVYNLPENEDNVEDQSELVEFTLNIINEDGEMILKVSDSNEMEIIESNGQKKLLIYKHVGEHFRGGDETVIYSL